MTRKKVKLAFITNDSARKATYKKRKRGLLKKMDELTTLCDVKACAVLYSPYETKPVVWPESSGAREVISSFVRLPEIEKAKKMVSQEEFLRQRVAKAHEQLKRQQKENREKEMTQVMYQCLTGKTIQNMGLLDLNDLGWVINQHLNEINKRMKGLKKDKELNFPNNLKNVNNRPSASANNNNNLNNMHGHKGDIMDVTMQMIMQPWSSYMDMINPPMSYDNHHHPSHHVGMGTRLGHGENSNGASSSCNANNMSMMMLMGQCGDVQDHSFDKPLWSNQFFP